MKRSRRAISMFLAVLLLLTACSSGGKRESRRVNWTTSPAYLAEDMPLPVSKGDLIGCCTDGENIYVLVDEKVEDTVRSVLFRISTTDGAAVMLEEYAAPETPDGAVCNRFGPVLASDGTLWVYETWTIAYYDLLEGVDGTEESAAEYHTGLDEFHHLRQLDPVTGRQKKLADLSEAVIALEEEDGFLSFASFAVDSRGDIYFARAGGVAVLDQRGNLQFTLQADMPRNDVYNAAGGSLVLLPDGSVAALTVRPGGVREVRSIDPAAKDWGAARFEIPGTELIYGGAVGVQFFYTAGGSLYGWPEGGTEPQALLDWSALHLDGSVMCFVPMDGGELAALSVSYDPDAPGDWYAAGLRLAMCSPTDKLPEEGRVTLVYGTMNEAGLSHLEAQVRYFNKRSKDYYIEIRNYGGAGESAALAWLSADVMSGRCPDLWDESMPIDLYARKGYLEDLWPWIDGDEGLGGRDALMVRVLEAASVGGKLYKAGRSFSIQTLVGCADIVGSRTGWTMEELLSCYRSLPEDSLLLNPRYNTPQEGLTVFMEMNEDRWVDWTTGNCSFDTEEFKDVLTLCASLETQESEDTGESVFLDPDGGGALRTGRQLLSVASLSEVEDIIYYETLCGGPEVLSDYGAMLRENGIVGNRYKDGKLIYPDAPATCAGLAWEETDREEGGWGWGKKFPLANDVKYGRLEGSGYAAYPGYPTPEGAGGAFQLKYCAAMSASCAHKEGAWAFIRSLLLSKGAKAVREGNTFYSFSGFPINKADFDALLYPEITWFQREDNGEYILDQEGNRIEMPLKDRILPEYDASLIRIGLPIKLVAYPMALQEEQVEQFMKMYDTIDRAAVDRSELLDIILEQAQPYFAGDKTLEETANLIQRRAQLYVNENR